MLNVACPMSCGFSTSEVAAHQGDVSVGPEPDVPQARDAHRELVPESRFINVARGRFARSNKLFGPDMSCQDRHTSWASPGPHGGSIRHPLRQGRPWKIGRFGYAPGRGGLHELIEALSPRPGLRPIPRPRDTTGTPPGQRMELLQAFVSHPSRRPHLNSPRPLAAPTGSRSPAYSRPNAGTGSSRPWFP